MCVSRPQHPLQCQRSAAFVPHQRELKSSIPSDHAKHHGSIAGAVVPRCDQMRIFLPLPRRMKCTNADVPK